MTNEEKLERFERRDKWFMGIFAVLILFGIYTFTFGAERRAPRFAEAYDSWTSDTLGPDTSLYTWLNHEAILVCNILNSLDQAAGVPTPVDPHNFCNGPGTDPTRPPPEPECDWGDCPEDE